MRNRQNPSPADAETLAIAAFSFLAAEPERLDTFLSLTGLSPETVRQASAASGFLPAVLDYLIGNERLLLEFAADQGIDPATVLAARAVMPGAPRDM